MCRIVTITRSTRHTERELLAEHDELGGERVDGRRLVEVKAARRLLAERAPVFALGGRIAAQLAEQPLQLLHLDRAENLRVLADLVEQREDGRGRAVVRCEVLAVHAGVADALGHSEVRRVVALPLEERREVRRRPLYELGHDFLRHAQATSRPLVLILDARRWRRRRHEIKSFTTVFLGGQLL